MADYRNVLGTRPKTGVMQIYPALDHFRRARESGWMRPFDLAEYETCRDAEAQRPVRPIAVTEARPHPARREAWDSTSEEASATEARELATAD